MSDKELLDKLERYVASRPPWSNVQINVANMHNQGGIRGWIEAMPEPPTEDH